MERQTLSQLLIVAANFFRLGMEAAGSEKLIDIIEQLTQLLTKWPEAKLPGINAELKRLYTAKAQKNLLFAADILEFRILPLVNQQDLD